MDGGKPPEAAAPDATLAPAVAAINTATEPLRRSAGLITVERYAERLAVATREFEQRRVSAEGEAWRCRGLRVDSAQLIMDDLDDGRA